MSGGRRPTTRNCACAAWQSGSGRVPHLPGGETTPALSHKALILEKTEGTPFFMEEVVQTLAEEGVLSGDRGHYRL